VLGGFGAATFLEVRRSTFGLVNGDATLLDVTRTSDPDDGTDGAGIVSSGLGSGTGSEGGTELAEGTDRATRQGKNYYH